MRACDAFFFGALFFLVGVLAGSAGWGGNVAWPVLGGVAICLILRALQGARWAWKRWEKNGWLALAVLFLLVPAGVWYYRVDDERFLHTPLPEGVRDFTAMVVSNPVTRGNVEEAVVELLGYDVRVLVKLPAYPKVSYGDTLTFTGNVEEPFSDSYRAYLAKEGVRGVVAFPKVETRAPAPWSFRGALYSLRERMVNAFRRTLPAREAALMSGITVGAREDFSEEFRTAMAKSGTTHITALSGYNISVVTFYVMSFLLLFLPRRAAFAATLAVVVGFVLMTGAEASVVRAALMGGMALLAREWGRRADVRNIIIFAALLMVLGNPKVLAFDLGFQLSFLALLGIVYVKPALDELLGGGEGRGVFSWRENLAATAAAQLAVAPLLIHTFGSVSVTSLAANLLVLGVVPLTMGLGFLLAGVSLIGWMFAEMVAFAAFLFLKFQVMVIEVFAALTVPIAPPLPLGVVVLYYAVLVWFVYRSYVERNRIAPHRV